MPAQALCSALYCEGKLRLAYGRERGLAYVAAMLDASSETKRFAASAALCAFSLTGEGRALLAATPTVQDLFKGLGTLIHEVTPRRNDRKRSGREFCVSACVFASPGL